MSVPVFSMSEYDFKVALKKTKLAIIPVGSLEQHGNHLPVSTDSLIAEYIARTVAEKVNAFVLPVISYGVSFEHKPMFNETPYEITGKTNALTFSATVLARSEEHTSE